MLCVVVALQIWGFAGQRTGTVDRKSCRNENVHHLDPECDCKCGIVIFGMFKDVFDFVHALDDVDGMEVVFESPVFESPVARWIELQSH